MRQIERVLGSHGLIGEGGGSSIKTIIREYTAGEAFTAGDLLDLEGGKLVKCKRRPFLKEQMVSGNYDQGASYSNKSRMVALPNKYGKERYAIMRNYYAYHYIDIVEVAENGDLILLKRYPFLGNYRITTPNDAVQLVRVYDNLDQNKNVLVMGGTFITDPNTKYSNLYSLVIKHYEDGVTYNDSNVTIYNHATYAIELHSVMPYGTCGVQGTHNYNGTYYTFAYNIDIYTGAFTEVYKTSYTKIYGNAVGVSTINHYQQGFRSKFTNKDYHLSISGATRYLCRLTANGHLYSSNDIYKAESGNNSQQSYFCVGYMHDGTDEYLVEATPMYGHFSSQYLDNYKSYVVVRKVEADFPVQAEISLPFIYASNVIPLKQDGTFLVVGQAHSYGTQEYKSMACLLKFDPVEQTLELLDVAYWSGGFNVLGAVYWEDFDKVTMTYQLNQISALAVVQFAIKDGKIIKSDEPFGIAMTDGVLDAPAKVLIQGAYPLTVFGSRAYRNKEKIVPTRQEGQYLGDVSKGKLILKSVAEREVSKKWL